jgi:hypothetical protein
MKVDLVADIDLIERFSRDWQASAPSYRASLPELRRAADRLLPILTFPTINGRALAGSERERLRALEKEVACLSRQPLFFPDMFHGVTLQPDGSFRELHRFDEIHLRANGLLGIEDRMAVREIYERLLKASNAPLRVAEIGSAAGRGSTEIGGEIIKRTGGVLYCIDPWLNSLYFAFLGNIQIFDLESTVLPVRSPSVDAAMLFDDGSLDAVFVDGSHIYPDVVADIDAYLPKIKKNGYMFGHDLHDIPSRFDRNELLSIAGVNNSLANYTNATGQVERVDVHPGVILAVQDRFGDDVERIGDSVVWAKRV